MNAEEVVKELKKKAEKDKEKEIEKIKRFRLNVDHVLCVRTPHVRELARKIKKEVTDKEKRHKLALELWKIKYNEVKDLAGMIDVPELVDEKQMENWAKDFNSWGTCDSTCGELFDKTNFAWKKPFEWSKRKEEYVKRAAFSLIAYLAVHDKKADDKKFLEFFPLIKEASADERNFVKKAVNWALRGIGKRNTYLNKKAIKFADEIKKMDSEPANWIASDALRELKSDAVKRRLTKKNVL